MALLLRPVARKLSSLVADVCRQSSHRLSMELRPGQNSAVTSLPFFVRQYHSHSLTHSLLAHCWLTGCSSFTTPLTHSLTTQCTPRSASSCSSSSSRATSPPPNPPPDSPPSSHTHSLTHPLPLPFPLPHISKYPPPLLLTHSQQPILQWIQQ
jgi:hypothetical protein